MWDEQRLVRALATGFSACLGVELDELSRMRVTGRMDVTVGHLSDTGYLHGGVMMTFADALAACGARLNLASGSATATMESKTNFLAPCGLGLLHGESVALHVGSRTSVWQTTLSDASGRRIAVVTQTQMVLAGKAA
jgi:uncharacterized protein (TIGR00369 family)